MAIRKKIRVIRQTVAWKRNTSVFICNRSLKCSSCVVIHKKIVVVLVKITKEYNKVIVLYWGNIWIEHKTRYNMILTIVLCCVINHNPRIYGLYGCKSSRKCSCDVPNLCTVSRIDHRNKIINSKYWKLICCG